GPQEEYAKLEPEDARHQNFLVLGPWRHGSWALSSRRIGDLDYGQSIGDEFRTRIEAKVFGHYLKDEPGFDLAGTTSFQTSSNTWDAYHPPPHSRCNPDEPLSGQRRRPELGQADNRRQRDLRERSGEPHSLSPPPYSAHLRRGLTMVHLDGRGSAFRHRPQGC